MSELNNTNLEKLENAEMEVENSVWNKVKVTDTQPYELKQAETEDTGTTDSTGSTDGAESTDSTDAGQAAEDGEDTQTDGTAEETAEE